MTGSKRLAFLEAAFDQSMATWDHHLGRCEECLSYGEHLCGEGEFLAEDVEYARTRLTVATREQPLRAPRSRSLNLPAPQPL